MMPGALNRKRLSGSIRYGHKGPTCHPGGSFNFNLKAMGMDWRQGSSCTAPALQAQSPEFKPQFHQKRKKNLFNGYWSNYSILDIQWLPQKKKNSDRHSLLI
jgi:hypothetical protein